jgi:hypothetical protein
MTRLLEASGIVAVGLLLTLLVVLIAGINLFGPAVLGMLTFLAAVASLVFSIWLRGRGELLVLPTHLRYAAYFRRVSYALMLAVLLRYALPGLVPGLTAGAKSWLARWDRNSARAAVARLAPQPVACGDPLVVAGKTVYWYHPDDDPLVCYDSAGKHPRGKGDLAPVDDTVARIIERQRERSSPVVAEAKAPPAQDGEWLKVPQ